MIITIASLKGGAGKTALAVFLSQLLSENKRVLAVDLDHNNNLTDYFLRRHDTDLLESANVYHVLSAKKHLKDCTYQTAGPDVLPATISLTRAGLELARDPGSILRFGRIIKEAGYDHAIIDTPPALSFELSCGLYAAQTVLSPVSAGRWILHGHSILAAELKSVQETRGSEVPLFAVCVNVSEAQKRKLGRCGIPGLLESAILSSRAVKHCCDLGRPLSRDTNSYAQYASLVREVLSK
jgi:cellulose biosynthesis protein BcsQ